MIKLKFNLKPYSIMNHFTRRSCTTSLADAGISITNLKRGGCWKSAKIVEEYLENSRTHFFHEYA
eukprot:15359190-Ditylum_brightwellii.AAC.2